MSGAINSESNSTVINFAEQRMRLQEQKVREDEAAARAAEEQRMRLLLTEFRL